ncbi:hypothetical protein NE237_018222 [Protea cynaroides]|uniref:Uncharacterized protein n=1 Tax=Protea cynaroides TaxID=273540 RepID=A0A9Q0QNT5_9MAGN|nr:hypothetical protein NE237_018222 [Protea cynaroides]
MVFGKPKVFFRGSKVFDSETLDFKLRTGKSRGFLLVLVDSSGIKELKHKDSDIVFDRNSTIEEIALGQSDNQKPKKVCETHCKFRLMEGKKNLPVELQSLVVSPRA